jgi:phospholipid/cholesterol/gamma-HCH transport system substrate-binding protein
MRLALCAFGGKKMKKYGNEFKVGLFIILCILSLAYLTVRTGKLNIKKGGYYLYVTFDEVAGLGKKAPVMLNGLEVGKVEGMDVSYANDKTQVMVKLWLNDNAKVRDDATVSIKTLGLMGEKYIQITSRQGNFIKPENKLEGKPYMDLDAMMEQAKVLTEEAKNLAASLNYTVSDNKQRISAIIKNLESTSNNIEELSADLKSHPWKLLSKPKKE